MLTFAIVSDVWILKGLYPGIVEGSVIGSDCVGILTKPGSSSLKAGQRVLVSPSVNWDSDKRAPEGDFRILGLLPSPGTYSIMRERRKLNPIPPFLGTLTNVINIDGKEVFPCPSHLSTSEAAALPLAGVTAYRSDKNPGV